MRKLRLKCFICAILGIVILHIFVVNIISLVSSLVRRVDGDGTNDKKLSLAAAAMKSKNSFNKQFILTQTGHDDEIATRSKIQFEKWNKEVRARLNSMILHNVQKRILRHLPRKIT